MPDHYVSPAELLQLLVIGSAPALAIGIVLQWRYALRAGWVREGRGGRVAALEGLTITVALGVSLALWALLPGWLLTRLPSATGVIADVLVLLAVPSALGMLAAVPLARWTLRCRTAASAA